MSRLEVGPREFITILGPSGCGKSTLLRIIAGLEPQSAGTVAIDGLSVDGLPPDRRDIAMVFQSYALYPHLTVAENIAVPLRMRRTRRSASGAPAPARRPRRPGIDRGARCAVAADACGSRACWRASRRSSRAARSSAWRSPAPWCAGRASS